MKEIQDIIAAFDAVQMQGKTCALATVVHVDGSSYRRPGARMLIDSDGQLTGAISGGCLEGDALKKAQLVMMQQNTMLVTYDTNDEDDAKFGMGLGCNGIIHVLIEPVNTSDPYNPISFLRLLLKKRQQSVLITLFSPYDKKAVQQGTCFVRMEDGVVFGCTTSLEKELLPDAQESLITQTSFFKNHVVEGHTITAFVQLVIPPVSLVILGAGNDIKPVVAFAGILGWETTIMDGRPNYASRERFPSANKVLVRKAVDILNDLTADRQTIFLLMTHNYNYDLAAMRVLIKTETPYIGMLGPKKKLERMMEELKETGNSLTSQQLAVIHTPAGLDIGAETPEEIALSIVAEIKAILAGRNATPLNNIPGVIHSRDAALIKS